VLPSRDYLKIGNLSVQLTESQGSPLTNQEEGGIVPQVISIDGRAVHAMVKTVQNRIFYENES